ncbi:DLW-39 family protein [Pseudarthrobacter sp. 902506025]|uniref:DLW-39 family protein n=1 Tax=Pseudarthrobacter sp. 902506025 TaxID=3155291 RepID=UPI003CC8263E
MQVSDGGLVRSYPVPDRNGEHVKKLLVLAAAIAGFLVYRKAQESEARKTVWSKSTDTVD